MPTPWMTGGCGGPRFRLLDEGSVEIEGEGVPERALPAAVKNWTGLIYESAQRHGLPAHIIAGVMALESGGKPQSSSTVAYGLMALTPGTAKGLAGRALTKTELVDPALNIDLGTKLLRQLWDKYQGNLVKVAFSYNAGSPRCGTGCVHDETPGSGRPCVAGCAPNRWNLVADCPSIASGTVDYAGIVIGYANRALRDGFPLESPSVSPPSKSAVPVVLGLLGGGALLAWSLWKNR